MSTAASPVAGQATRILAILSDTATASTVSCFTTAAAPRGTMDTSTAEASTSRPRSSW